MHILKSILKNLLYVAHGFLSGVYTPGLLSLAFNFMHGIANNPDGESLMPLGIILVLTILTIDILIIVKTIKSKSIPTLEKVLTIGLFVIVKSIGLMVDQDGWRNFTKCFTYTFIR